MKLKNLNIDLYLHYGILVNYSNKNEEKKLRRGEYSQIKMFSLKLRKQTRHN